MSKTNTEYGYFCGEDLLYSCYCIITRIGIARTIREKNSVRFSPEYFLCRCFGRDYCQPASAVRQDAQNILLYPVVIVNDAKTLFNSGCCLIIELPASFCPAVTFCGCYLLGQIGPFQTRECACSCNSSILINRIPSNNTPVLCTLVPQ